MSLSLLEFFEQNARRQDLDKFLPAAIGAGINSQRRVRREILKHVVDKGLKRGRKTLPDIVERSLGEFQSGVETSLFRSFNVGREELLRRAKKTAIFTDAAQDAEITRLATKAARSIAKDQKAHIVRNTKEAIGASIRAGESEREFLARMNDVFDTAGITPKSPHRIATVFETSMATSYNAGRQSALLEMEDTFPWWIYLSRDDARVRPNHQAMHRFVAPADGNIWRIIHPPNGFRCRCIVDGMTQEEKVATKGLRFRLSARAQPDKGFRTSPLKFMRRL